MHTKTKRSRILTLDLLRGFFLGVIIIDHLGFFPSVFELLTGRGQMWASAAEGFFIISGLLVGYIYGPRMVRNVQKAAVKIWKRAFLLYALNIVLTCIFVWWGNHSDMAHLKEGLWIQPHMGEFLYKTLTLQYYYGWADFLPYYAVFMAWAPLALYACIRGRAWIVLVASVLCWLWRGTSFEMSWQLLFMVSLVVGWYLPQIERYAMSWPSRSKRWARLALYGLALSLVVASALTVRLADDMVHGYGGFAQLPAWFQSAMIALDSIRVFMTPLIVKWTLEPVRLATAVVWFIALYVFVRRREALIDQLTYGWVRTLGEQSLVVYIVHAFAITLALLVASGDHGLVLNTVLGGVALGVIYVVAQWWRLLARSAKRYAHGGWRRLQPLLWNEEAT